MVFQADDAASLVSADALGSILFQSLRWENGLSSYGSKNATAYAIEFQSLRWENGLSSKIKN